MLDPECRIPAARLQNGFFQMLDMRIARTGDEVVLEFFNGVGRPFGKGLDTAVVEISDVAADLMPRGRPLGKIAIADALYLAADDEPSCHGHVSSKLNVQSLRFRASKPQPSTWNLEPGTNGVSQERRGIPSADAGGRYKRACREAYIYWPSCCEALRPWRENPEARPSRT